MTAGNKTKGYGKKNYQFHNVVPIHFRSDTVGRLLATNVLGICEGTVFEKRQLNISTKVDRCTTVQLLPSAVLLQIPC